MASATVGTEIHRSAGFLVVVKRRGESGDIITAYSSPAVTPKGDLYQPVWDELEGKCSTLGVDIGISDDPEMVGGQAVERVYKVFDTCPSEIEHRCAEEE